MKNFKLLLALAIVLGAGSAFTTIKEDSTTIYVKVDGVFTPQDEAGSGRCIDQDNDHCQYTLVSPNNYQPVPGDVDRAWESL
ncbi:MAG: hypothetical protein BGO88_02980 [Flavobacterium sp. 38-13]|jgi:hypothetical protein|uniref:DUF6520 family protein n=1 Tax=Flavobacterium sp. 38-13 TaxID=1896168 RepID=UPI00095E8394|nr:DUF6520 family protein [Flavobacterium sp. 38-13]OJX54853.1 MAG: hypothetical protein BGO88_02980 [Flavobacterium sp. 38-13]